MKMLPVLTLEGTPYERGLAHGREARKRIAHNVQVYFERFQYEGKLALREARRRAEAYVKAIEEQNAEYAEEMRGVAEGSGLPLWQIAALNVRYEIMYHQFSKNAAPGCTTIAVLPNCSAEGHLYLAENWDWVPEIQGLVLHSREGDLEVLSFTEAGIVGGKIGLNSYGLGLAINGLNTTDDDWARLKKPFHVRCYEVLRAQDLEGAIKIIAQDERPCSANFLLGHADEGAVNVEAAPRGVLALWPEDGLLVHTNHFLDPEALGVTEPPNEREEHSIRRLKRAQGLLREKRPLALDDLRECLRDHEGHPYGICRHVDEEEPSYERYQTVVSVLMDLHAQTIWISDGPPCESAYQELRLELEA